MILSKNRTLIVLLLFQLILINLPVTISEEGSDQNWPMYAHDAFNTGFSTSTAPSSNYTFLTIQLNPTSRESSPNSAIMANGKLYIAYPSGEVYCIADDTADLHWKRSLNSNISATPAILDGKLYIGAGNNLVCLNAETGVRLWQFPTGNLVKGSATVSNDKIYFGSYDNNIYCIDATGSEIWRFTASEKVFTAPAVVNDRVYFAASHITGGFESYIYCLNAVNGSKIWEYYRSSSPATSCTVVNEKVYVGIWGKLYCLDAIGNGDGTTTSLWSASFSFVITPPAVAYDQVYVGSVTTGQVTCLNGSDHTQIWTHNTGSAMTTPPAIADEKIYFGTKDKQVICLDAIGNGDGTTDLLWRKSMNPYETWGQPCIANGNVWIVAEKTWVYGFGGNQPPEVPDRPSGPETGESGIQYEYITSTRDPDGDQIWYQWDFGDEISDWIGPYSSGTPNIQEHSWTDSGLYQVKARAKNEQNQESSWSSAITVIITSGLPRLFINAPSSIPEGSNFTVVISTDAGFVQNATVEFNSHFKTTNTMGKTNFTAPEVIANTAFDITVTKDGYDGNIATITILNQEAQQGWVYGTVKDTMNSPLENASVCLTVSHTDSGIISKCIFTNENGEYYNNLPSGTYTVKATKYRHKSMIKTNIEVENKSAVEINFQLEKEEDAPALNESQTLIHQAIEKRNIIGSISFQLYENTIHYEEIRYSNVTITPTEINLDKITLQIMGESAGKTILISINKSIFSSDQIVLEYDNETIEQAESLTTVLNTSQNGYPSYWIVNDEDDVILVVNSPHFSLHNLTIYEIIEEVSKLLLLALYVAVCIIGISAAVYSIIFSGTLRFRWR